MTLVGWFRFSSRLQANQLKDISTQRYVSMYSFAIVCLALGDKPKALCWLEQSHQDRAGAI
jgi:hypothetical protein